MRIVRRDELVATPWKNGGGVTREIACYPKGSRLDEFDWRISTAEIALNGPFSAFEGIDRHLFLLEGDGLWLGTDPENRQLLLKGQSTRFRGEEPICAELVNGPVCDLNIMVRREKLCAWTEEKTVGGSAKISLPWDSAMIFVLDGRLDFESLGIERPVGRHDTVIFEPGHAENVRVRGEAKLLCIGIDASQHPPG